VDGDRQTAFLPLLAQGVSCLSDDEAFDREKGEKALALTTSVIDFI